MPKKLSEIKIKDIMTTKIVAAQEDDSILDVARIMAEKDFNGLPVVGEDNKLLGMITTKELLNTEGLYLPTIIGIVNSLKVKHAKDAPGVARKIEDLKKLTAGSVMNPQPFFLTDNITLERAAEAFLVDRVDLLPVIDRSRKLVGIVSKHDILRGLVHPLETIKLRPEITAEIEPLNVMQDIGDKFVVVSRRRAHFWYFALLTFLLLGVLLSLFFITRVKLNY